MKDTKKVRDLQVPISIEGHPLEKNIDYLHLSEIEDALNEFIDNDHEPPEITRCNNNDPLCSPMFFLEFYINNMSDKINISEKSSASTEIKAILYISKKIIQLAYKNMQTENLKKTNLLPSVKHDFKCRF